MVQRFFFAISIAQLLHEAITAMVQQLQASSDTLQVAWSRPDHWHVTLCFLGAAQQPQLVQCLQYLEPRVLAWPVFEFVVEKWVMFAGATQAILALQVKPSLELTALHALFKEAAVAAGFAIKERGFFPHITLGKLPKSAHHEVNYPTTMVGVKKQLIEQITLFASEPTPQGSRYIPIQHLPLRH